MSTNNEKILPNAGPWIVRPDYGKENVYRLWDKDSNYHDDTSPEVMDANTKLMSAAPILLAALQELYDACPTGFGNDRRLNEAQIQAEKVLKATILRPMKERRNGYGIEYILDRLDDLDREASTIEK